MAVWEYNVVQGLKAGGRMNAHDLQRTFDILGREGWELVAIITDLEGEEPFIIFKRLG